jgi:hypothetical protein
MSAQKFGFRFEICNVGSQETCSLGSSDVGETQHKSPLNTSAFFVRWAGSTESSTWTGARQPAAQLCPPGAPDRTSGGVPDRRRRLGTFLACQFESQNNDFTSVLGGSSDNA